MDSFELMKKYIQKECNSNLSTSTNEERDARALVNKVRCAKVKGSYREKAEAVGVKYEDYMAAKRLIGKKY